ncbi:hypothetical protein J4225_00235 [Candidatus Pacearchaeota archaeon]|nr:hypothetical protein [Candidatus Pacearchaeota archaeon]
MENKGLTKKVTLPLVFTLLASCASFTPRINKESVSDCEKTIQLADAYLAQNQDFMANYQNQPEDIEMPGGAYFSKEILKLRAEGRLTTSTLQKGTFLGNMKHSIQGSKIGNFLTDVPIYPWEVY